MHSTRSTAIGGLALLGAVLVASCEIEPAPVELHYDISDETRTTLDGYPVAQEHVAGALEMLFGTPSDPGYMLTQEWTDNGYNPNSPAVPNGEYGSGEITDEEWGRVVEGNLDRFERQLAAIDTGDYEKVRIPSWMPDLAELYATSLEAHLADEYDAVDSFPADMRYYMENWYPSLRESAELYRQQCLHCHGVSGGGDGPTAEFLDPTPRDYRRGIFKFTALSDKARPRRADLMRVLEEGIYTTMMPSFARFTAAELNGLVDYVRLLAIRGEVEGLLALDAADNFGVLPAEKVQEEYQFVWTEWSKSADYVIQVDEVPRPTPEMIERGRELYMASNDETDCYTCHGRNGRGRGNAAYLDGELVDDDWGDPIQPRDFTRGIFRFGRRPVDIYYRMKAGINGSPMPAHGEYSDEDLWALVHYVRSIPSQEAALANAPAADDTPQDAGH